MKNLRKNKKFVMGASIALAFIMVLSATFAWFTAQDSVENKFKTGGIPTDSVKVWEIFKEPEEWKPGQKVQKDVGVANLGKEPVFVRASFKEVIEKLTADGKQLAINYSDTLINDAKSIVVPVNDMSKNPDWKLADAAGYTVTGLAADDKLYVREVESNGVKEIFYSVISSQNGAIKADFKLEDKAITATNVKYQYYTKADAVLGNWTEAPFVAKDKVETSKVEPLIDLAYHAGNMATTPETGKWFYNEADGWFYFVDAVKGGAITPFFLGSVTLNDKADNTFQYLDYKLTVMTEGIQGSKEALSAWGITEASNKVLYDAMTANLTK